MENPEDEFCITSPFYLNLSMDQCKDILWKGNDPDWQSSRSRTQPHSTSYEELELLLKAKEFAEKMEAEFLAEHEMNAPALKPNQSYAPKKPILKQGDGNHLGISSSVPRIFDPVSINWLRENFEKDPQSSVARADLYAAYLWFCEQSGVPMCNQALFGKSVRAIFPNLKTRRIGVRGKSKYHYCGLRPKWSNFLTCLKDKKPSAQSCSLESCSSDKVDKKMKTIKRPVSITMEDLDHLIILLPHFPTVNTLQIPPYLQEEVAAFLVLYRSHANEVIHTVLTGKLAGVREILSDFWTKNLSPQLSSTLLQPEIEKLTTECDKQLYQALNDLLMPSVFCPIPDAFEKTILDFAQKFGTWVYDATQLCPEQLRERKLKVAIQFSSRLFDQLQISHLAAAAREILHNPRMTLSLSRDWSRLDVDLVICKSLIVYQEKRKEVLARRIRSGIAEFQRLLSEQATLDRYMVWLKTFIFQCLTQDCMLQNTSMEDRARDILLLLSFITGVISCQLVVGQSSGHTFGALPVLEMLIKDYAKYMLEEQLKNEEK
ncbi:hypothetical protein CHS0354_004516 [Potamilus streckersoni]|uniref:RFX-type winged-helix domain-containing protein n=1 Tax=Potamilus streckersoni TaxID=2493646 RepID=A0AAE0S639_9BIVA|nr:hypothetical protein CHS0354_004516 [Potamilus streckersoni]